jgi:putative oxidoreductase
LETGMDRDRKLELALFAIRVSVAIFLLIWAVDKIVNVKHAQGVYATFYGWNGASSTILAVIGSVQVVLISAFAVGLLKSWTYMAIMLMHAGGTIGGWSRMIPPYGPQSSQTFWAAVPVLAAIFALYLLRDRDRLFAVGR